MRSSNISLRLIALWLASMCVAACGQTPRALSQYVHDAWGTDKGFPGGAVYAISQSQDGYLWFGTERGLVRFDGFDFILIQQPIAGAPSMGAVRGLIEDKEGSLWVRLDGPHLLRYRNGVFEDAMEKFDLTEIAFTVMWTDDHGELMLWGPRSRTLRYHDGQFESVLFEQRCNCIIVSATQTEDHNIWLGTRDAGLFEMDREHLRNVLELPAVSSVNALETKMSGSVWMGTDTGLKIWDGHTIGRPDLAGLSPTLRVLALKKDRRGNLWVGTDRGILRITADGVVSTELLKAPGVAGVAAIYQDRDGDLWYAGPHGVERLREGMFTEYSAAQGLPTENNGPIYVDGDGLTWFAPASGGLFWLRDGRIGQVSIAGLDKDVIYSISGGGGELWLGRQEGGLTKLTKSSGSYVEKTYRMADGLAQNSVYTVHRNRDGTVWAGTVSAGLSELRHGAFTNYTVADGLESNAVFSIVEGHDGTMWFAAPSGLASFANGHWTNYGMTQGLPSRNVRSLFEDAEHVLWIGTSTGLARISNGHIEVPLSLPGPLREEVLGITQDKRGALWIATSDHMLQINHDRLLAGSLVDTDLLSYGTKDGLLAVEGVRRDRTVVADRDGRIWLSLVHGVALADPDAAQSYAAPSRVRIESASAGDTPVNLTATPKLRAGTQNITFNYGDTNLSMPERIRFRYRLDGPDQDWSNEVALRQVEYTNLGPGKYRFRIVASNGLGAWNGPETVVPFVIEPALWQTWYFEFLCAALLLLIVFAVYRLRMAHLREQMNLRFQDRLIERTRIAQDLHDTLLQGVLSASMQLDLAEDQVPEDSPAKPLLRRVLQLMGQVTEEGRRALRGLRSNDENAQNLETALSRLQNEFAADTAITFQVATQGTPRALRPIVHDEVYRVGREAIVNAFMHAKPSLVSVEVEYANRFLRLLVSDDGQGIDPAVLIDGREGHYGLPGMRERSENIRSALNVRSRAGAGTEVELIVPGAIAFEDGAHGPPWRLWPIRKKRSRS